MTKGIIVPIKKLNYLSDMHDGFDPHIGYVRFDNTLFFITLFSRFK